MTTQTAGENMEQEELIHCWRECKMVRLLWKTVRQIVIKLNIFLSYSLAIALLGIYQKKLKLYIHTKTCIKMFIAALFIVSKT